MDIVTLGSLSAPDAIRSFRMPAELVQHLQILLRGIALHAIEGDPQDLRGLQHRMSGIADSLTAESSGDDLLVGIGQALRAVEDYNQRVAAVFKGQASELRSMLSTMTETVMFITSSSDASVRQLTVIETRLQRASTLEDTRHVRALMMDCLTLVRNESLRLQSEARTKIKILKSDVDRLSSCLRAVSAQAPSDPVTGLPGRPAAQEAITLKISGGKEFIAALFVLDRMAHINGRFGRLVGDEILVRGAQSLAQKLSGATLYRWTGPAFMAVFDTALNISTAENRARQAGSLRLEKNIEADDRTVLLLVTCSSSVQRVSAKHTPEALFKGMDEFMASIGAGNTDQPAGIRA